MSKSITRIRARAYFRQKRCCYYCRCPMWLDDFLGFCSRNRLVPGLARALRCTAEHVIARQDGGTNHPSNIVAACLRCNAGRHARKLPLPADDFMHHVRRRIEKGKWHSFDVLRAGVLKLDSKSRLSC